ncbi:MAG: glycosyltransferase family 4 protein [Geminocystis sp.]|nr:glycosyltransferase family 4 protein [Geminocystis sp.]
MRIAMVSNSSWSLFNFRFNLAQHLKKNKHEVVLIAPRDSYSKILEREFEYHDICLRPRSTEPIQEIKTLLSFYKLYEEIRPDLTLHFTIKPNIYGGIVCRILGLKYINNISGLGTVFAKEDLVTKLVKLLYKYSLANAEKIFFQNREDYEVFVTGKLVDKNKCEILPGSGVDTNKFTPVKKDKNTGNTKFLLASRLLWEKGVREYVEAARIIKSKHPHVKFYLLGFLGADNPTAIPKKQIDEWVKEGVVEYMGVSDKIWEEIAKVDCVVLPSYYREGIPRVLLEAASMAKPIITTDNVGCREVVDHGINGYLCQIKNPKDLADKMEKIINLSPKERVKMGQAGREKVVREFDESIIIRKYLEAIRQLERNGTQQ